MIERTWTWGMLGLVALALAACSGDGDDDDAKSETKSDAGATPGYDGAIPSLSGGATGRCQFPAEQSQCTDWREFKSPSWMVPEGVCSAAQGTFEKDKLCEPTDRLGGCQGTLGDGSKQTNWFYKGRKYADAAAVQASCDTDDGEVFVTE